LIGDLFGKKADAVHDCFGNGSAKEKMAPRPGSLRAQMCP
jgi:hypothetical protein